MSRRVKITIIVVVLAALLAAGVVYAANWSQNHSEPEAEQPETSQTDKQPEAESEHVEHQHPSAEPKLYYVALEDDGKAGPKVGCDDSLVAVDLEESAEDGVKSAFLELLKKHEREVGQSGLYNALYQSDLKFESWQRGTGAVTVRLTGQLKSGGSCDDARIVGQLKQTAMTSAGVDEAIVLVNGKSVDELLSGK